MGDNAGSDLFLRDALGPLNRLRTSAGRAPNADADAPGASGAQNTSSFEFKGSRSDLKRLVQVALQAEISVVRQALENDFKRYFADLDHCLEEKFLAWALKAQRGEERDETKATSLRVAGGGGSDKSTGIMRLGTLASTLADQLTTLERRLAGAAPLGSSLGASLGHDNVTASFSPKRKWAAPDALNVHHLDSPIEALASRVERVENSLKSAGVDSDVARPGPGPATGLDKDGTGADALRSFEARLDSVSASHHAPISADTLVAIQISKLNARLSNAERCIKWLTRDRETLNKVWEGDPLTALGFQAAEDVAMREQSHVEQPQPPTEEHSDLDHDGMVRLAMDQMELGPEETWQEYDGTKTAYVDLVSQVHHRRTEHYASGHGGPSPPEKAAGNRQRVMMWVDIVSTCVVMVNAVFLGIAEELALRAALDGKQAPSWIFAVNLGFAIAFLLELIIRIRIECRRFFTGPDRKWNVLDTVLVVASWLDVLIVGLGVSVGRILRCLRALRVLKFVHGVKDLRPFRIMMTMIQGSLGPLVSATGLLLMLTFAMSVFISSGIVDVLSSGRGDSIWAADVRTFCGNFGGIITTLFASATGGLDWMVVSTLLQPAGSIYVAALWLYVLSTYLCLFNVVTGFFVLGAKEAWDIDHEKGVETQMQFKNSMSTKLMSLLMDRDVSRNTNLKISDQRLEQGLRKAEVSNLLLEMDTDACEIRSLFYLLDVEGVHEVPVKDLVMGLLRLKGTTRNSDILTLIYSTRRLSYQMEECIHAVKGGFLTQCRPMVRPSMRSSVASANFGDSGSLSAAL